MNAKALAMMPSAAPIFAQCNNFASGEIAAPLPITIPAPATFDATINKKVDEWRWKLSILASAIIQPKKSRARGAVIDDLASRSHIGQDGAPITLSARTLRRWLDEVDRDNLPALARKRRADNKARRCLISRAWDDACPLPETEKTRIAAELDTYVRSLWASGAPGVNRIEAFASSKLAQICRAAGWPEATQQNCTVGRYPVEQHRGVGLAAIKERHAKLFFDQYTPRIKRNRDGLKPMDVVIGDVHPLDVIKAHDGREVHARLIAWLDLATYDIHVTVVLLDKGKGIRQEDIARSFVAMVNDWGLPRCLYLDNGSEYKWDEMMEAFKALVGLTNAFEVFINNEGQGSEMVDLDAATPAPEHRAVIRAKPHRAPSKQIEGVFGILERGYFSLMPGWIGGDRMYKRTHKVGAAPRAYEGETEDFIRDLNACLNLYRSTPQTDGNAAAREVVAAIQDIDSRIAALNEKRQGIGEAPVNRAEFLSYIGTSIDQKIGRFGAEKEREMVNIPTAFFALESHTPSIKFLSPSFAPVTISEEACYFYLKPMILARMAEIADGLDFPEDSIPIEKRREMIAVIDLEITKLRTERAELASQLQKAGVVR